MSLIIKLVFEMFPSFQLFSSLDCRFILNFFSLLHKLFVSDNLSVIFCDVLLSKYFTHFLNLLSSISSPLYSTSHLFPLVPLLMVKFANKFFLKGILKNNKQLLSLSSSLTSFISQSPIDILNERVFHLSEKLALSKTDLNLNFDCNVYFLLKFEALQLYKSSILFLVPGDNLDKSYILDNAIAPESLLHLINTGMLNSSLLIFYIRT